MTSSTGTRCNDVHSFGLLSFWGKPPLSTSTSTSSLSTCLLPITQYCNIPRVLRSLILSAWKGRPLYPAIALISRSRTFLPPQRISLPPTPRAVPNDTGLMAPLTMQMTRHSWLLRAEAHGRRSRTALGLRRRDRDRVRCGADGLGGGFFS